LATQASVDALADDVPTASETAAAVLGANVEAGATVVESLRLHNSVLGGKVSGGGSATETFRDLADTKDSLVSSVTETGNRTAEVYDLT
jgi:bifunctional ADP-heptose synthase (sugar kinase/adenylyltransferase)